MLLFDVRYVNGEPVQRGPGGIHDASADETLRWIGFESGDPHDIDSAASVLEIDVLAMREQSNLRRPALTSDGAEHRLTLRTLHYDDHLDAVETGHLDLYLRLGRVVSLYRPAPGATYAFPAPELLGPMVNEVAVAQALCQEVVSGYIKVCEELLTDVEEIEESVFSAGRTSDAQRIYLLKREVAEVRRAAAPLIEPLAALTQMQSTASPMARAFSETGEQLRHVIEHVDSLEAMLNSVFDAYVAQISLQQNDDMRKISAAAALVVVPTLIAGIYGMNFTHMPELRWSFGYPAVLGVMVALVSGMFVFFKRSGWL